MSIYNYMDHTAFFTYNESVSNYSYAICAVYNSCDVWKGFGHFTGSHQMTVWPDLHGKRCHISKEHRKLYAKRQACVTDHIEIWSEADAWNLIDYLELPYQRLHIDT